MSISEETALREPSARLAADTPLDRLVEPLQRIAERLRDEPTRGVPPGADEPLLRTLVAATATVYAAASEATGGEIPLGEGVSTTDALVLACALLRAHHLNPFDLALWFTRGEAR
ncbi:hypothetical protein FSY75_05700 [Streptomyces sp. TR1341]|uniref:hypothetical protein n=1 Tax=Streptomyces sp. TR1341 TaxID=2601266 RepID=UPI00138AF969|nr:hypothetical protein [Streptomyces sp. TR1341]